MEIKHLGTITVLTVLLAVLLAAVSFSGAFIPGTYGREVPSMAAQGAGQDMVDLFLVVPLLILSLFLVHRKVKAALFLFGGTVFYILYSFFIYAFGIRFNSIFHLYCATLGISLYLFILVMAETGRMEVESWFRQGIPARSIGGYMILVSVMFYVLWLKDTLPAVLDGSVPSTVSDYNLLVNPVHVLDMAVALPGLFLVALLLIRKRRFGYVLAPMALVFLIILAVALAGMVVAVNARGIGEEASVAGIFGVLAVISAVFLVLFLKKLKPAGSR